MILLSLFVVVWILFALITLARGYRILDRWIEFKRWGSRPGYEYFGNEPPAGFPIGLLGDAVFFVRVHNCVQWSSDGIRHVAFDLELPGWSRSKRWRTVAAAEGWIQPDRPWPRPEDATAFQGSGWVMLMPRQTTINQKIWLWRMIDSIPPRDQFLEPDVIFELWQSIDGVATRLRTR